MTTPAEAMRLALEALELSKDQLAGDRLELIACHAWPAGSGVIPEHDRAGTQALREYDECLTAADAAIAALRAALAAAPQPPAAQPATVKESLTPGAQQGEEVAPTRADLIAALRFYATGEHFILSEPSAWDTVSGEPQNWQCDESGTATVEDGYIAKATLEGRLTAEQIETLEDGETLDDAAQPAAAPQPVAQGDVPPVLVRDLAEIIGVGVPSVCAALLEIGRPPRSTNMAIGGEEAVAVAKRLAAAPAVAVGEPVAWSPDLTYPGYSQTRVWANGAPHQKDIDYWRKEGFGITLAYTAPPVRQALTDERIDRFEEACIRRFIARNPRTEFEHREHDAAEIKYEAARSEIERVNDIGGKGGANG